LAALLFALALLAGPAAGQDKPLAAYFRETWTTRQGLPHNQVNAIAQTPDGYLWFGTWEGLVRYNGLEFHIFDRRTTPALQDNGIRSVRAAADGSVVVGTSRGGVSLLRGDRWRTWMVKDGLAQEEIMDALLDRRGRLWVATESAGIDRIDVESGRIQHLGPAAGLPSDVVYGLLLDRDDSVWAATAAGIAHLADDRVSVLGAAAGLPEAPVFTLMRARDGLLYAGTESGVYRLRGGRFEQVATGLPEDGIPSLAQDAAGHLWIGTVNHGLIRLGPDGPEPFSSERGLPNNRVASLLVDREGSLWAGTNAGLLRLSDAPFSTYNGDQGLSDDYVRAIAESRDGSLWFGTSRGLNQWRGGRVVARYTSADGMPGDSILSLLEDRDGSLLVGTYTEGLLRMRGGRVVERHDSAHGMPGSNQVRAIAAAADGTVWIGTTRGLVRWRGGRYQRFGTEQGLPREFVISLHLSRDGSLWVGTANGAAHIVGDRASRLDLRPMNGAQDVFGFLEDPDGTLWMATDRGLVRYRQGRLQVLGLAQGLPIDTLFQVVDDAIGGLWLTSNRGVIRIRRDDAEAVLAGRRPGLTLDQFGEADGLASSQCNGGSGPAALRDRKGRIWVATARGAAVVSPVALHDYRRVLPRVVVEDVIANDRPVSIEPRILLPPGITKLEFHYASPSFVIPRFIHYRYRLEGVDADWIERGNQRVAQYTNLKPGHYRFVVDASAPGLGQGWSSQLTALEVAIRPTLWQRPWFQGLLLLSLAGALAGLFRWRMGHLRQRAAALEAVVDQRTSALREQADRLIQADQEKSELLARLQAQSEAFERQAREDWLTGLGNRRSMEEALSRAFEQARASGQPLSFALIDIDNFKRINDGYSHAAGDRALGELARVMQAELGALGKLARWGGEEFAVLFEGLALDEARRRCERLRAAVERLDCGPFAPGWKLSISVGVAERTGLAHYERLVVRADALLYEAKRAGRNRVSG
jgi:diguanylate cyclase (GGDEF)-like protein